MSDRMYVKDGDDRFTMADRNHKLDMLTREKEILKLCEENSKLTTEELVDLLDIIDRDLKTHQYHITRLLSSMSIINTEIHIRGREQSKNEY